jgi:hypothetical protein
MKVALPLDEAFQVGAAFQLGAALQLGYPVKTAFSSISLVYRGLQRSAYLMLPMAISNFLLTQSERSLTQMTSPITLVSR